MTTPSKFKQEERISSGAAESLTTKFQAIVPMLKSPVSRFRNKKGQEQNQEIALKDLKNS